jgi:2-polyprenyl-3-methyl-5-hydroxy-6-metoxy-1,4-benzoquinol methylase
MISMASCYLCGEKKAFIKRPGRVRDNQDLDVLECQSCGLVFLSSFQHILEGFYENSQMHDGKVAIEDWVHQTAEDDERRFRMFRSIITNKSILDFGCGNGGFLRRINQVAALAVGVEPERRLQTSFQKEQLNVYSNINEVNQSFDIITLFHVLEHIPDPEKLLKQLVNKLNAAGSIIIEVPNADDALLTLYQSSPFSHFTYWSCHLFLFNRNTLALLAKKAGLKTNYIKQLQRYPLSNHLHWLAKSAPDGHILWSFLDSQELHGAYEKQLSSIGVCDTLLASFGVQDE